MSQRIKDLRNFDINLYNFIASGLNANGYIAITGGYTTTYVPYGVYLQDGFPEDLGTIKAPAISIDHEFTRNEPFQLGPGKKDIRRYSIVVYGRLKGERDDLGQLVYEFFDHTMDIYDQNILLTGGSYVKLGYADFDNVIQRSVTDPTLQALKYQMNISLEAEVIIDSGSSLV